MTHIIDLPNIDAKKHFLLSKSYASFDLPPYFDFSKLLEAVSIKINNNPISDFYKKVGKKPSNLESVNYLILSNKDGKYDWRPLQLIHPAIYVDLINIITDKGNWKNIQNRFKYFKESNLVECKSLPVISTSLESDRASQVHEWWLEVEQESIKLSLDYDYLLQTDILNCYGSIYTHSVAWAIHTRPKCKNKSAQSKLFGDKIDRNLRSMSWGQTNGIPQGSMIMDLIAELVLGYVDELFTQKIKSQNIPIANFKIIRYRDDYRIFSNNRELTEQLVKLLSEILIDFGLRLNTAKTSLSHDVISSSIKDDKLYWIQNKLPASNEYETIQYLHQLSKKFPNSGVLEKQLHLLHDNLMRLTHIPENVEVMISYIVDIAYRNPRTYPVCCGILSNLLAQTGESKKIIIINKIVKKFQGIPNTGMLEIWLQRMLVNTKHQIALSENLCKLVNGKSQTIWNSDWLDDNFLNIIKHTSIIDSSKISRLSEIIEPVEISLFYY